MAALKWAEKIDEAKKDHLTKLDLSPGEISNEVLNSFPDEILELEDLEYLNLSNQLIRNLPGSISRLQNLVRLDVYGCGLRNLPSSLERLPNLRWLDIGANAINDIPLWVKACDRWVGLGLRECRLMKVPDWILQQADLEELDLTENDLQSLPDRLGDLKQLKRLFLSENAFKTWPLAINNLINLQVLSLDSCELETIPHSIENLKELRKLHLAVNNLEDLPGSFAMLSNLEILNLRHNLFNHIPDCIFSLQNLKNISFDNLHFIEKVSGKSKPGNTIRTIPPDITQLEKLEELDLRRNPIETPPIEVARKGIDAIREYYRQANEQGVDHIYEAKLIIVGEPGAGKTSLAHKLQDPAYMLDAQEKSTKGIDISRWSFLTTDNHAFTANLWDFGGQEIYLATHQYFLTRRSLYLLVIDTRQEDTIFDYWLNVIEMLGGDSPILIIKNEKQDRQRALDETQLRGGFASLREILPTNLSTNRGLKEILKAIRYYMTCLPHVGASLPKSWMHVRAALEADPRNYISREEFFAICQCFGFNKMEDKLQLSGYLHDLGICLHFQEDPLLKHYLILKPHWATEAAYRVLDDPDVIKDYGSFMRIHLKKIWKKPEYNGMHDELLQLMIKFKLCYPVNGLKEGYIAPQLIRVNRPEYIWDDRNNLHLRYCYDFMPRGILTHLIVVLHEYIARSDLENQSLVWRKGVIFQDRHSNTRAEVIEDYLGREIRIRTSGVQKKELLAIVSHEMDLIHDSYPNLKFDALIPCNCTKCQGKSAPAFFQMEVLIHYMEHQRDTIECRTSFEDVSIRGLMDDIIPLSWIPEQKLGGIQEIVQHYYAPITTIYVDELKGDLVNGDQTKINFSQVYEHIEQKANASEEERKELKEKVQETEKELKAGLPNETKLQRLFLDIAKMSPDILDVVLAAATNPVTGISVVARKIVEKVAQTAKNTAEQRSGNH